MRVSLGLVLAVLFSACGSPSPQDPARASVDVGIQAFRSAASVTVTLAYDGSGESRGPVSFTLTPRSGPAANLAYDADPAGDGPCNSLASCASLIFSDIPGRLQQQTVARDGNSWSEVTRQGRGPSGSSSPPRDFTVRIDPVTGRIVFFEPVMNVCGHCSVAYYTFTYS